MMGFVYNGRLDQEVIRAKMQELAKSLEIEFKNSDNLCCALYCKKNVDTTDKYTNSAIAVIGDNVLKLSLSQKFYKEQADKEYIEKEKQSIENNECLKEVCDKFEIYKYAFNDESFYSKQLPDHKKLPHSKHDSYVEAVIGAMFFDQGFDDTDKWIVNWLLPHIKMIKTDMPLVKSPRG